MVLLEEHTASSSAALNFTTWQSSTYDDYTIEILNLLPASNGVDFELQMSTNGGSSYDTASNYAYSRSIQYLVGGPGMAQDASGSTTSIRFTPSLTVSNDGTGGVSATIKMYDPANNSSYKRFSTQSAGLDSSGPGERCSFGFGVYFNATAVNAFRVLATSGNLASGTIRVYGLTH